MQANSSKEISLIVLSDTINSTKSITDSKLTDIIKKTKVDVVNASVEVIKTNMVNTIDGILDVFESEELDNRSFFVDEIEIALNISREGAVSILSTISSQTNIQSGVIVKLKKRGD